MVNKCTTVFSRTSLVQLATEYLLYFGFITKLANQMPNRDWVVVFVLAGICLCLLVLVGLDRGVQPLEEVQEENAPEGGGTVQEENAPEGGGTVQEENAPEGGGTVQQEENAPEGGGTVQEENAQFEIETVFLSYLSDHLGEFENKKVRVAGVVSYPDAVPTPSCFWFDGVQVCIQENENLPHENSVVSVVGRVTMIGENLYAISAESWTIREKNALEDLCWSVGTEFIATGGALEEGPTYTVSSDYTHIHRLESENSDEVLWSCVEGNYPCDPCAWNRHTLLPEFIEPISGELVPRDIWRASLEDVQYYVGENWEFVGKIRAEFPDGGFQEYQINATCWILGVENTWICTRFENENYYTDICIPTVHIWVNSGFSSDDYCSLLVDYSPQLHMITYVWICGRYHLFELLGVVNLNVPRPDLSQPYFPVTCQFSYQGDNLIRGEIFASDPDITHFTLQVRYDYNWEGAPKPSIDIPRLSYATPVTIDLSPCIAAQNFPGCIQILIEAKDEENRLVGTPIRCTEIADYFPPTRKNVGVILPKNGDYYTSAVMEGISAYIESIREDPYLAELGIQEGDIYVYEGEETVSALDEFIENLFYAHDVGYFIIVGEDFISELGSVWDSSLFELYYIDQFERSRCPDVVISFVVCPPEYSLSTRRDLMENIFKNFAAYHSNPVEYFREYTQTSLYLCDLAVYHLWSEQLIIGLSDFPQVTNSCFAPYDLVKVPNFDHSMVERELKRKPLITHIRAHGSANCQGMGLYHTYTTREDWRIFCEQYGTPSPIITVSACGWKSLDGWPGTYLETGVLAYFGEYDFNCFLRPIGERVRAAATPDCFFGDPLVVLPPP